MNFSVIALTPKTGTAKNGRPYAMLIAQGVFTDDDGVMNICECTFFAENDRPVPQLVVGQNYTPIIKVGVTRDKKLGAFIDDLLPVKSAEVRKAA